MKKRIEKQQEPQSEQEVPVGYDMIRFIAGLPVRQGRIGGTRHRSVITHVHRDAQGRVIGSTQRIEETEVEDFDFNWMN